MGYKDRLKRRAERRGWSEQKLVDKINRRETKVRPRVKKVFKGIASIATTVAVDMIPASGLLTKVPGVSKVTEKLPAVHNTLQKAATAGPWPKSFDSFLKNLLLDMLPWQTIKRVYVRIADTVADVIEWVEDYDTDA